MLSLVIFGLITFIYGASIYYFLPLSLISENFGVIGGVFLWIILGILLGFVLLSKNVEHSFQKFLTNGLLFFTNSSTKLLILKNLAAHRLKNKKTSLMFSLSVGVFIMISVGFDLILQSNKNLILMKNGSEISVFKKKGYFTTKEIMNPLMILYDKKLIKSFSFFSLRLDSVCLNSNIDILNYGITERTGQTILAVNSGFFNASTKLDLTVAKQNKKFKKYTPSEQLYFSELKGKIGISSIFKYKFDLQLNSDIFLEILNKNQKMTFITKPAVIIDNAWGLYMSNSPSDYSTRESIVSVPFYLELLQKCRNYFSESFRDYSIIKYESLPIWGIKIKPKDKITEKDIHSISTILKKINSDVEISFFVNMKKRLDIAANIVFFIFYIISSIVLIFCLFNLTASMTINIYDQKKEIAVFRSLGTKKNNVIFIYIAESFILVLSSSIIGLTIGSIISYTMALQWTIMTKVNVVFNFPMGSMILIISISILGGILSTYFPAKKILNYSISELIRSN